MTLITHGTMDFFALLLMWRAYKMTRQGHQGLFETISDYKTRKWTGFVLIALAALGIYINHKM